MFPLISRLVIRYHRWIGLFASLPFLLWALSGLMHPVMTRVQPQPAAMTPPAVLLESPDPEQQNRLPALSVLLAGSGIDELQSARLMLWQKNPVWQLSVPQRAERIYIDAVTGKIMPGLDEQIAVLMARHYAGEPGRDITATRLVTEFTPEYQYVNRLLPVWRVDFAGGDHLLAYVETSPLRLATLDNDGKALFGKFFRNLHSWAFIADEKLRDSVMTVFLLLAFASSLGGLWLYGYYWRKEAQGVRASKARRWHSRIGIVAGVTTLTFTGSGILHLQKIDKQVQDRAPQLQASQLFHTAALLTPPGNLPVRQGDSLLLMAVNGKPMWRLSAPAMSMVGRKADKGLPADEHAHHRDAPANHGTGRNDEERYFSAIDGQPLPEGAEIHARALAEINGGPANTAIRAIERISRFEGEYGFINKRLPVYKVSYDTADHLAIYVETASGLRSAEVRDPQRTEGFLFAYLHKWIWLDGLGKNSRDFLVAVFALLNVLIISLGLRLWLRRRSVG